MRVSTLGVMGVLSVMAFTAWGKTLRHPNCNLVLITNDEVSAYKAPFKTLLQDRGYTVVQKNVLDFRREGEFEDLVLSWEANFKPLGPLNKTVCRVEVSLAKVTGINYTSAGQSLELGEIASHRSKKTRFFTKTPNFMGALKSAIRHMPRCEVNSR